MQGTLLSNAGKASGASLAKAAVTTAARSGATALRPQAPAFVKRDTNLSHSSRAQPPAAAVADAPAPSVASAEGDSQLGTPSGQRRSSINDCAKIFKFLVPSIAIGPLMGHQGAHLVAIKANCGAYVQVTRPGTSAMNDRERMVVVGADTAAGVKSAVAEMLAVLERENATDRLRRPGSGTKVFLKMLIPSASAGKVLGPGGETIGAICNHTASSVVVEAKSPNAAFVPFRFVNFLCPSTARMSDAIALVIDLLDADDRYHTGVREITSVAFKVVEVPERRVGSILGPQGTYIQALQELLRCKIGVADSSTKPGSRWVSVYGPPNNVRIALDVIATCTGARHGSLSGRDAEEAAAASSETADQASVAEVPAAGQQMGD